MKTRWLIYILLGVFLSSCYKEENIEGEEDEPKYKVEDSEDPLDHFIYGFYPVSYTHLTLPTTPEV